MLTTKYKFVSKKIKQIIPATVFLLAAVSTHAGFTVSGTTLLDGNGQEFIMRGVNHAHTWYPHTTTQALADIASVNANTVRVVLSNGHRWNKNSASDVANIISLLKSHHLIGVLEVHDTTGYGEESAASSLDQAVDYWVELADVLKGQEDYIIINIGNEPIGNFVEDAVWVNGHVNAIKRLRAEGFAHTLMVDAPSWGQDWELGMFNNAAPVAAADELNNTVFSVHLYQVYPTYDSVYNYVTQFRSLYQVPIVIGEFADVTINGTDVAGEEAMAISEALGIGYLGWSWSGNSGSDFAKDLDITLDYDLNRLTTWGDLLINGENGLKATGQTASVFETDPIDPGDDTDPVDPGGDTDLFVDCQVVNTFTWPGGFQAEVVVTNKNNLAMQRWWTNMSFYNDVSLTNYWNADIEVVNENPLQIHVMNAAWNGQLAASESVKFGLQGTYTGTFVEPICMNEL